MPKIGRLSRRDILLPALQRQNKADCHFSLLQIGVRKRRLFSFGLEMGGSENYPPHYLSLLSIALFLVAWRFYPLSFLLFALVKYLARSSKIQQSHKTFTLPLATSHIRLQYKNQEVDIALFTFYLQKPP